MKSKVLFFSILVSFLFVVSSVYATLTVTVSLPSKSLTENEQVTVTVTVSNSAGSSTESNIVTTLSSSTSWLSVVSACATISSLSGGTSQTSTCIIKPTSTGSDLTLTATSESQGGTSGSGSTSGINVASQSSSLTASVSGSSSVDTSATFYVGVTVTAPSANDVGNARATISESGQCTVDTSYIAAQQSLGNITKGTSKSPTNWKLTSSSAYGTCTVTVNVVSDTGGSASPSKSITVGTAPTATSGITGQSVLLTVTGKSILPKTTAKTGKFSITIPAIVAKSEVNFSLDSPALAITGMKIRVVNTVNDVQITATKLDSRPRDVVSDVPGVFNQYISIDKANISAADIEKVTIDFKVEKNWIASNNIVESTIGLYRYVNDQWNKLETVKVSENETDIYYQAVSPGLSVFAISGEAKAVPAPTAEEKPTAEKEKSTVFDEIKKDSWRIVLIVIGFVVIGVVVYLFKMKAGKSKIKMRRK